VVDFRACASHFAIDGYYGGVAAEISLLSDATFGRIGVHRLYGKLPAQRQLLPVVAPISDNWNQMPFNSERIES